jgi:hypothetical protein
MCGLSASLFFAVVNRRISNRMKVQTLAEPQTHDPITCAAPSNK